MKWDIGKYKSYILALRFEIIGYSIIVFITSYALMHWEADILGLLLVIWINFILLFFFVNVNHVLKKRVFPHRILGLIELLLLVTLMILVVSTAMETYDLWFGRFGPFLF